MKIFILLLLFLNSSLALCPNGTITIPSSLGNKWSCFSIVSSPNSFLTANQQCQQKGGFLISISNGFVNFFITGEIDSASSGTSNATSRYWIGVSDMEGLEWENVDDGSLTLYFNWASGEPGDLSGSNDCVSVDSQGNWYNDDCFISHSFICEIPEILATTEKPTFPPSVTTTRSSTGSTTPSPFVCRAYIPFSVDVSHQSSAEQFYNTRTFITTAFLPKLFPRDMELAPFITLDAYNLVHYPIAQSFNQLMNTMEHVGQGSDYSQHFSDTLDDILNFGVFDYKDGIPINVVVFTSFFLRFFEIEVVQELVDKFTTHGHTVTAVLIDPNLDSQDYEKVNGLNVVSWSDNDTMVSLIQQGFKCGGGAPVFNPCESWISFGLDDSSALSHVDFQTELNFVSNAISKINHPERIQVGSTNYHIENWYNPYSISYLQDEIKDLYLGSASFNLNATLNAIYSSYIRLNPLPQSPIGALVFVSDTSSPSNYEGADGVVNLLKSAGFKLTFILMGPNVDQSKLTKYTNNFITWRDMSNPQPDNWENVYLDAYACPK